MRELGRIRALLAVVALAAAGTGQWLLEVTRLQRLPPHPAASWLLGVSAVCAVVATWHQSPLLPGAQRLRLRVPRWPWIVGCVPGCASLLMAVIVRPATTRTVFLFWAAGIVLLLAAGVAHALVAGRARPADGRDGWSTHQVALAYVSLVVLALGLRMVLGIENLPAFVESDEMTTAVAAKDMANDPYNWFGVFWVGLPNVSLTFDRAAQLVFGYSLWGNRMSGVVLGTLAALFTFAFARRLLDDRLGFAAALVAASFHPLLHWSRNAQMFIETPMFAALIVCLLMRVWTGGSLLAWVGAGIATGIGTQTYQPSFLFPVLVPLTALGWAWATREAWKPVLVSIIVIEVIALLVLAPLVATMVHNAALATSRAGSLFIFSAENLAKAGPQFYSEFLSHARDTLVMFNWGADFYPAYGAKRSVVDAVTAALVPIAAATSLVWLRSPVGWLSATWGSAFVVGGVLLCNHPPAYHRMPAALLFVAVASVWALARLLAVVRAGLGLGRWIVLAGCLLFAVGAVAANAHFYFVEYRAARPTQGTTGLGRIMCRYAATHTIVDATALDGYEYVPLINPYPGIDCPGVREVRCGAAADLWNTDALTSDPHVILIVPAQVRDQHPGRPRGYRVVRDYIDASIAFPAPLPLAVYELERDASAASSSVPSENHESTKY